MNINTRMLKKTVATLFAILSIVLVALSATSAQAGTCRITGSFCAEGPETRTINGGPVYRDCWRYQNTYQCNDPNYVDYCAGISNVAGCVQTNSVCQQYDFNGTCLRYTNTYRCGNDQGTPAGTIKLDTSYTVTTDSIDRGVCDDYKNNPTCHLAENVCIEPGGTRIINGLPVTKDCWKWQETYSCITANYQNYCTPLRQTAGCTETTNVCLSTAWDGTCNEYERSYRCDGKVGEPLPPKVTHVDTTYTVVKDELDTSQCDPMKTNANCTLANHVCVQPGGTRNINGLDVYKDCWEWKDDYVCASETLKNDCDEIRNNPACVEQSSTCIDTLPAGQCGLNERKFSCKIKEGAQEEVITCDNGICYNGRCASRSTNPDSDFFSVIAAMEAGRQIGQYFDTETGQLFKGTGDDCTIKLGGLVNCCRAKGGGGTSNSFMMQAVMGLGKGVGKEAIRFLGSPYMYDALFSMDLVPTSVLAALYGPEKILQSGSEFVFGGTGNIGFYGITYAPGMSPPFAFDPTSLAIAIAMQVITQYLQCDQGEQLLGMRKSQQLCTYVGSWCSVKVLGVCLEKKESYCCYNSKMSRIFNEQGRTQIGKGYGDTKNPDCSGFTISELEQLDMSKMDLSEFTRDIVPNALNTEKLNQRATDTVNTNVNNYFNSTP